MERKKKVYFAILNCGNLRREMIAKVIPAMQRTPGIELIWENPDRTWANPISSNRNMIVKRFLETDCDFLLLIDDDVVPLHNPCEMAFVDRDVVASPALVRSAGQVMTWTAYTPHKNGVGYSAIDLDSIDDMYDVLEVAVVGTGCIMVKREVLENVKEPFHSEFDEDGIQIYGTDFAFCRRATNAGYKVYTMTHRRCEHFKICGLADITAWDRIDYFDRTNNKYGIPWGEYAITQNDWRFIKSHVDEIRRQKPLLAIEEYSTPRLKVLEFGAGLSSLLLSEFCDVTTYETEPEFADLIKSKALDHNRLDIKFWDGRQVPEELQNSRFDLAFVDGPKEIRKSGEGRETAIEIASKCADHIIIHDAGRGDEEKFQRKYLRSIFKLEHKSGSHITRCHYWVRRPKPVTLADIKNPFGN